MTKEPRIAYFSMEVGLESAMPTYAGGLGILAGDTIRSAADLQVPMVAVTLLHRDGYFRQSFDEHDRQREAPVAWSPRDFLAEAPERVCVMLEGKAVEVRAWRRDVVGAGGFTVPVLFLDTDLPQNGEYERTLTHSLYGGDARYRFCQEAVLGIGGVRMLRALGYPIQRFHMNEGHAALLAVELLEESAAARGRRAITFEDVEAVRAQCVFTTHTPVGAGHDQFPLELVQRVIGRREILVDWKDVIVVGDRFNMTYLALNLSRYVNGVAKRHGEVARLMFASYAVDSITNGVHAATWARPPLQRLFFRHIPDWRRDNYSLRYALGFPKEEVWDAHVEAKADLIRYVNEATHAGMNGNALTIGFARRATAYKRPDLLFRDVERLNRIGTPDCQLQIVYAGKAHPHDGEGKDLLRRIRQLVRQLGGNVRLAFLEDYNIDMAGLLVAGVDVWLNTPRPPLEASGTSGMKAALNGVPSLSVLDGWWIEGHFEGLTGWSIGNGGRDATTAAAAADDDDADAASLYEKLERQVIPTFYRDRDRFINTMRHCIALNGSFFNTQRMVQQYATNAYLC